MTAITAPTPAALAALSREVAFVCAADGAIRWTDERSRAILGLAPGDSLLDRVVAGSRDKARRLLESGGGETAEAWELMLDVGGGPTAVHCRARATEGGILVVGSLAAQDFGALLTQMSDAMGELSALHRQSERQEREITEHRESIRRLDRDLQDSGRGMAALYQELDEQSDSLRVASEVKSRFVANMSHELRTPLSSIIGLTKLLLSRIDGELSAEQEKQIGFIRKSADELLDLVNDLLDLSRMDAGKIRLRPSRFTVDSLFGTLRGQLRVLGASPDVRLVFAEREGAPTLDTDEGKVAQILRNLVTNALKFTERGEVHVDARDNGDGTVSLVVADTGIGIAPADQERIFEEFYQVDTPLHRRVKGTGLGLSVSRRMAEMLGGRIDVASAPGEGSTFTLTLPAVHPEVTEYAAIRERSRTPDPARSPVLVVEDDAQTLFLYEKYLASSGFQVIPARSVEEARRHLETTTPAAIVLDVMLEGESSWQFLGELKANPRTCDIPALVVTVMDREKKARALGADEFFVKPVDKDWLLRKLRGLAQTGPMERVLVIDDDQVARYLLRRLLADTRYLLHEAEDGPAGIRAARERRPDVIFLDFVLPSMTAFEVLDELKSDPTTRTIPVIISTSKQLDAGERARLAEASAAIVTKDKLSREVAITRIREALEKSLRAVAGGNGTNGDGGHARN